jgi:general secretion pathway protein J
VVGETAPDDCGDGGFTLVELLVAIALLSLLSVILLSSVRFGLTAWERGAAHVDRVDRVQLVQSFLRHSIEDAYPLFSIAGDGRGRVDFAGTPASLQMLSPVSRALGSGGRARLTLALSRGEAGFDLVVTVAHELAPEGRGEIKKVLLSSVQSVNLSYFGRSGSERADGWRGRWMEEPRLPKLVRIEVSFPPGDTRSWPEFTVAPRIGADVGCVYDPLTKRCRGR